MTFSPQQAYGQPAPQQFQQQAPQYQQQAPAPQGQGFTPQPLPTFRAAPNPSESPRQPDFRGRLVLILPESIGTAQSKLTPGQTSQYVSCKVVVLEGGPVVSTETPGRTFDGHEFTGVWLSGVRVFGQLQSMVGTGEWVLGRLNTQKGHGDAAKGNAWGIEPFTPQDAELATRYLHGDRPFVVAPGTVPQPNPIQQSQQQFQQGVQQYNAAHAGQYAAPAQPQAPQNPWPAPGQAPQGQPQYQQQAPQGQPYPPYQAPAAQQAPAPEPAPQQANPWSQNGQPLHQGGNPFAQQ